MIFHRWRATIAFLILTIAAIFGLWRLETTVNNVENLGERLEQQAEVQKHEAAIRERQFCNVGNEAQQSVKRAVLTFTDLVIASSDNPERAMQFRKALVKQLDEQFPNITC